MWVVSGCGLRLSLPGDEGGPVPVDGAASDGLGDTVLAKDAIPFEVAFNCAAPDGATYSGLTPCPTDDGVSPCDGIVVGNRCQIERGLECLLGGPCPSTWSDAQYPSSCKGADGVVLGTCGDTYTWYRPALGLTCTYNMPLGKPVGMRRRADSPQLYCPGTTTPQDEEVTGYVPEPCVVASNPLAFSCQP